MANISLDRLAQELSQAVKDYTEDVSMAIDRKGDEVARELSEDVSATSPKHTGKYAKGFKVTKDARGLRSKWTVWNKKHYRRVHLLEFGHAKVNGGRVRAYPHVRPAYDRHATKFENDIKRIIKNGGGT